MAWESLKSYSDLCIQFVCVFKSGSYSYLLEVGMFEGQPGSHTVGRCTPACMIVVLVERGGDGDLLPP